MNNEALDKFLEENKYHLALEHILYDLRDFKFILKHIVREDMAVPEAKEKLVTMINDLSNYIFSIQIKHGIIKRNIDSNNPKNTDNSINQKTRRDIKMSNLINYAKDELALLAKNEEQDEMQELANKCILELIETFEKQEHSGFSANYVLSIFNKLARFESLTHLTGEDDEWIEVSEGLYQNNRAHNIFKENGKAYKFDHYIFEDENGNLYTNKESRKEIEFPYWIEKNEVIKYRPEGI